MESTQPSQPPTKSLVVDELTEDEMQAIQRELMQFGKKSRIPSQLQIEIDQKELEELQAKKLKKEQADAQCDRNVKVTGPPSAKKGVAVMSCCDLLSEVVLVSNSIFDVTSSDVQRADEERKQKSAEAQMFIPRSEREREKEKQMAKFSRCHVKY